MQTSELPLFQASESNLQANSSLNETTSQQSSNPFEVLDNAFKHSFLQPTEESTTFRMRRNLGEVGKAFSDEQIECMVTEFQFLINAWLDEYEKDVFNGMTLKEVLNEK